jgi:hypothetical protein
MIPTGRFGLRALRRGIVPGVGASVVLAALLYSRLRYVPNHLFFYDNGNFAFTLQHFGSCAAPPQPPGYPLFVALVHAVKHFL